MISTQETTKVSASENEVFDDVDYDELDLSTEKGLEFFKESVDDVNTEALQYKPLFESEQFQNPADNSLSWSEIFQVLQEKFSVINKIISHSKEELEGSTSSISDEKISEMQKLYDEMIILRNHIQDSYQTIKYTAKPDPAKSEVKIMPKDLVEEKTLEVKSNEAPEIVNATKENIPAPKSLEIHKDLNLPTEADTVVLMRQVTQNRFLSSGERSKAQVLYESLNRKQAEEAPSEEVVEVFRELSDVINQVKSNPSADSITERVDLILSHVNATDQVPDAVLSKVKSLVESVRKSDLPISELTANYNHLEKYALEHESEWLSVCGVGLPESGLEGKRQVQDLREVLLVARDKHPSLKNEPAKQILVDKMVRLLANVSSAGLDRVTDIPEVINLMRRIDVPESLSGVVIKSNSEKAANDSVDTPVRKRKDMEIDSDNSEGNIKINVAKEAEAKIEIRKRISESKKVAQINNSLVKNDVTRVERATVASSERLDPINKVVPIRQEPAPPIERARRKESLSSKYLQDEKYQSFIRSHYTSVSAFDNILNSGIAQIEAITVDKLENWFGVTYESSFSVLKDMTIEEVLDVVSAPDTRDFVTSKGAKYETFLAWVDLIPEMEDVIGEDISEKTFAEIYSLWMVEQDFQEAMSE